MIEVIRVYEVKDQHRGQFELAFGPGGAWSELFAHAPGFRGTTLLREVNTPRQYLVIDLWDSDAYRAQWLTENKSEYSVLERSFVDWVDSEREMGVFRVLSEGTVRPRGGVRRRRR